MENNLISLAEEYLDHFHKGQKRKGGNKEPYSVHPREVRDILLETGHNGIEIQCMALLHDIKEDTKLKIKKIHDIFGYEISNGIYILSKNTIKKEDINFAKNNYPIDIEDKKLVNILYKQRLLNSNSAIQLVKIADMISNTKDLYNLKKEGIKRKLDDAKTFYIPLAEKKDFILADMLKENIGSYEKNINN